MTVVAGTSSSSSTANGSSARSVDKVLEEAELSGMLLLAGRKLKDFPTHLAAKHDLSDTVSAGVDPTSCVACCDAMPTRRLSRRAPGLRFGIGRIGCIGRRCLAPRLPSDLLLWGWAEQERDDFIAERRAAMHLAETPLFARPSTAHSPAHVAPLGPDGLVGRWALLPVPLPPFCTVVRANALSYI
uniref:Uncharacterized protein n=1 Tax=Plectus sambesii TaxID=2011161 RepID=A0A914UL61_9BILA